MTASPSMATLEPLLDELLPLDDDARRARLDQIRTTDPALADAAADLLQREGVVGTFLESNAATRAARTTPDRIGAWRVLEPIGRGGMGEVFLAERADGAFDRRVAIKIVSAHLAARPEQLARERALTARLRHPNIAQLLDGGVLPDGRAWLATEFVEGARLDEFVAREQPARAARVRLLRAIAGAVAHAHANLVVHRDLKPANVMVDRVGEPRLLDFGIARLVAEGDATATQDLALTPAFAAPEQLRGEPVTTRTDVYALGAMLYWLLTGRLPHAREGQSLAAIVAQVCEHDAAPPNTLDATIDADIAAVALKALARDPADRYASADAFADDLSRWLDGSGVTARLPTRAERTRRWLARHRVAAALATAFVLSLIAGIVATAVLAARAQREAERARLEADRASASRDFLIGLFDETEARRPEDRAMDARELLARGSMRAAALATTQPALASELSLIIGRLQRRLGAFDAAEVTLARLIDPAPAASIDAETPTSAGSASRVASAATPVEVALERARLANDRAQPDAALALLATIPDDTRYAADKAFVAATAHGLRADTAAALVAAAEARAIAERTLAPDDPARIDYVTAHGSALFRAGRFDESLAVLRDAAAFARRVHGEKHAAVARVLAIEVEARAASGDRKGALAVAREVVALDAAIHPQPTPATLRHERKLGNLLASTGEHAESSQVLERNVAASERVLGPDHPDLGLALSIWGDNEALLRDYDKAEPLLRRALDIQTRAQGVSHPSRLLTAYLLADTLARNGKAPEAFRLGVGYLAEVRADDRPLKVRFQSMLADIANDLGDAASALRYSADAIEGVSSLKGADLDMVDYLVNIRVILFLKAGDVAAAEREVARLRPRSEVTPLTWAGQAVVRGRVAIAKGDRDAAIRELTEAIAIESEVLGADAPEVDDRKRLLAEAEALPKR